MRLHGKRSNSLWFPMGHPKDPPDLIGEDLDSQAGDETGQHRAGQEVGKERQPKEPEHEDGAKATSVAARSAVMGASGLATTWRELVKMANTTSGMMPA
jgi:hypothetical protein